MLKKIIIVLFLIVIVLLSQIDKTNNIVIPKEAIRYRIIASSNSINDQDIKKQINAEIEPLINNVLVNSKSLNRTRKDIKELIPQIEQIIDEYNVSYNVNYGLNYFPEKSLYGVVYPAGEYESLVITLGEGKGDNWWCVLFPPLCLIEAKSDKLNEVTYTFYLKEIISKFY